MTEDLLARIAAALERMAPAPMPAPDFSAEAFAWHTDPDRLEPVTRVSRVDIGLLVGVNRSRDTLVENTRHFARGLPANNAAHMAPKVCRGVLPLARSEGLRPRTSCNR